MTEVQTMNARQRKFAMLGGLWGLAYLTAQNILPDFFAGVVLAIAVIFFVAALLPDKTAKKVRKWKRRGK